ncbi:MAG: cation:proton antiporter [Desulfobacteraceae bacterium]
MEIPILKDVIIIFGLAIVVIFICSRIYIPATVGLLITGIIASPHGLGLIHSVEEVEILAEIGVILLLFTIGIEFSMENLLRVRRTVLLGGTAQVLITILVTFFIALKAGMPVTHGLFAGFLVALSSTAIVLKIFQDRAEIESSQGRTSLAILIFQDIIVVPMMIILPLMAGGSSENMVDAVLGLLKGTGIIVLAILSARWVVPKVLFLIARVRSRELFLLSIIFICFAVAFLTHYVGLSLALGAFLAGLIISETEFSHETLGSILPFKDIFTSLFFVSMGMLLDVDFLLGHPLQVATMTFSIICIKCLIAITAVLIAGMPLRIAVLTGFSLCQVGEFSFILFMKGADLGLFRGEYYQLFLNVAVISMGLTPAMIYLSHLLASKMDKIKISSSLFTGWRKDLMAGTIEKKLSDHIIIIGFGLNGRNLAKTLKASGIDYMVVETNPDTVSNERKKGEPIFYGDATREEVLKSAGISGARVLVVVIADPAATQRIVNNARKMNPKIYIIARTRFMSEVEELSGLGANEVIPEEFETSIEIFSRALSKYLIPKSEIDRHVSDIRTDGYQMLRSMGKVSNSFADLKYQLPDIEIGTFSIDPDSTVAGRSLSELRLRNQFGITLLAVRREGKTIANPESSFVIHAGDILIFIGKPHGLTDACEFFNESCSEDFGAL